MLTKQVSLKYCILRCVFCCALALCLAVGGLPTPKARAELCAELPTTQPADISVPQEEIDRLAQRLSGAKRTTGNTFCILDATAPGVERLSTDYSAQSLHAKNGVVTVTEADCKILDDALAAAGLADASDAEKIAWALAWIHNNLVYDGAHSGSYVVSCFQEKGGQCNVYNGALAALLTHLGYQVQLVRGYRGDTSGQSAHWWVELLTGGAPYVMETGNREDGVWYYLASTYSETHGGSRDYIKSGKYVYSGTPYVRFGAAAVAGGTDWNGGVVLHGYVKKRTDCTVTEAGLRVGTSPDTMQAVLRDSVDNTYQLANDGSGFSMQYRLSDCGIQLTAGQTLYYDFYAVADGVTVTSAVQELTLPPAVSPAPTPNAPTREAVTPKTALFAYPWALTGLLILTILLAVGLAGRKKT